MTKDQELTQQLQKLGYSIQWLEYGLLTPEHLSEQVAIFDKGDDKNTEHYRYATFGNYLATKETLTDREFDNYMSLALADNQSLIAGSAMIDLFTKTNLTKAQFNKLIAQLKTLGDWTEKTVTRQTLLRTLKQEKLTSELFEECFEKGDNVIHEYLVGIADTEQLTRLSLQGRTKRIRNTAAQKLNKNK